MAREFEARYAASSLVLYPSRAFNAERYPGPPKRLLEAVGNFTCAYAGSINSPGFVNALALLAHALKHVGGRLLIYGSIARHHARTMGLDAPNIDIMGLIPSAQLIEELRSKADALFVPMSFTACDRANMELSFPSKLTDYTAAALPLLIRGPEYCSAVQWALANDGVAEIVISQDSASLLAAVDRLARQPSHRQALALTAFDAGERYFLHATAERLFRSVIVQPGPSAATAMGVARAT
jgi:hypothetical protein